MITIHKIAVVAICSDRKLRVVALSGQEPKILYRSLKKIVGNVKVSMTPVRITLDDGKSLLCRILDWFKAAKKVDTGSLDK